MSKNKNSNGANEPIEKQLWKSADKLRKNIDAAEYKHIVLGLIFLKYISDAFEELHSKLIEGKGDYAGADPEDADEYKAENVFFVPEKSRWSYLQSRAKLPEIGKDVDNAMDAIEKANPSLKDVLPKVFARGNLDPASLGGLIDLISNIALGEARARSADLLGHVFEYFLGEFALILFIDARNMGHSINRRTRELSKDDIEKIAGTYHNWRNPNGNYKDVKGFCNSASIEKVKELDYVLTPGRYVGLPDDEDDFNFNERFNQLKAEFEEQLVEEERLNALIKENLAKIELKNE